MVSLKPLIIFSILLTILPLVIASTSVLTGAITDNDTCIFVNQSLDKGAQVNCPKGYVVTGGGFLDSSGVNEDQDKSVPKDNGWLCEDSPGKGACYAVCCKSKYISTETVLKIGSQEKGIKSDCGNRTLLSGGFADNSGKNDDQDASIASGNSWYCLDDSSSANSECSAVCATPKKNYDLVCTDVTVKHAQSRGVQVNCPKGYFVTGGGFLDGGLGSTYDTDYNIPKDNGWYCKQNDGLFSNPSCYARCCAIIEKCSDLDEDGFYSQKDCGTGVDCNDHNPTIFPGANETCDFKDNNCDGKIDEGCNLTCSNDLECGKEEWAGEEFCIDDKESWFFEGITGYIYKSPLNGSVPFYEYYNQKNGDHFYTASEEEKTYIEQTVPDAWKFEKIAGYIFSEKKNGTVALYRFYNQKNGDHFYTISEEEKSKLEQNYSDIWIYENIAGYVFDNEKNDSTSLYRYYNIFSSFHFYTTNPFDLNKLEKDCSRVWDNKKKPICVNPGTYDSSCIEILTPESKEYCGNDLYEKVDYFCKENDVYLYTKIQDRGCLSGECFINTKENEVLIEQCDGSCIKGKCFSAVCGDKIINEGEECDDGNKNDGDGCSSLCLKEECYQNADCGIDFEEKSCTNDDSKVISHKFSCVENKCKEETHQQTNECGVDSCTQWEYYCLGSQSRRSKTCYDRGCALGECFTNATAEDELVKECSNGCFLGECNPDEAECSKDSDCGTDSIGEWTFYCDKNDVHKIREIIYKKCESKKCGEESFWEDKYVKNCDYECIDGACIEDQAECSKDTDCGKDYNSEPYCKDGDSYYDLHDFSCSSNECIEIVTSKLKSECSNGCEDGKCKNLNVKCSKDSDCGTDGWLLNTFRCSNADIWGIWKEYECNNPGTQKSKCKSTQNVKIKEDCGEDECEDWDFYCRENELWGIRTCYDRGCSGCNQIMCYEESKITDKYIKTCSKSCVDGMCL